MATEEAAGVESRVVVHNIAKRHNVGTMARSATAFGVTEFILVGRRDFNAFGSHGSTSHVRFRHFHSLTEARLYLKVRYVRNLCLLVPFLHLSSSSLFPCIFTRIGVLD